MANNQQIAGQSGQRITRRDAIRNMLDKGMSRSQAQTAFSNMMNAAMKDPNVSYRQAKNIAANNLSGARNNNLYVPEPREFGRTINNVAAIEAMTPNSSRAVSMLERPGIIQQPIRNVERVVVPDVNSMSFNDAFASARQNGLSEFEWNGNRYNTNLKSDQVNNPYTQDFSGMDRQQILDAVGYQTPDTYSGPEYWNTGWHARENDYAENYWKNHIPYQQDLRNGYGRENKQINGQPYEKRPDWGIAPQNKSAVPYPVVVAKNGIKINKNK